MKGIVWGLDRPTCSGRLDTLITEYELYWKIKPKRIKQSRCSYAVEFENGDIWEAVAAGNSSRGRKCNISLVDKRIPYDLLLMIKCATVCPPYSAITYY